MAQIPANPFYTYYESFRQEGLEKRRFKQTDILPFIVRLKDHPDFTLNKAGESVEGRPVYLLKVGHGRTKVLLWSQMHGNEPTATMALMDILSFFKQKGHPLDSIRQLLLSELTLYIIPMLNPDGAERYQRNNALGIDLNRDALRLQSPEAKLLKSVRDSIKAEWGFNLHDQNILYSAGKSAKPATISLLAPPYDEEESVNPVREKAMKLVVELNRHLQAYIPGQTGKWHDDFETRAFGDNMQKWGTSTLLIESGGYKGDPEKQYVRKLNFVAIMQGLLSIATESFSGSDPAEYYSIPENERYLFNLLIRNASVEVNGEKYVVDIGINRKEVDLNDSQTFYYKSTIEEVGDLSVFYGYEELDAAGMLAVAGKVYPETFRNIKDLKRADISQLLSAGYTTVRLRKLPEKEFTELPINILSADAMDSGRIFPDSGADLVLKKEGEVQYAVVNGFLFDLRSGKNSVENGLVEKE